MSTNTDALKSNLGEAGTHLKQAAVAAGDALKGAASAAGDEMRLGKAPLCRYGRSGQNTGTSSSASA